MAFALSLATPHTFASRHAAASAPSGLRRLYGVLLLGLVLGLGVFYLVQTNAVATSGYEIKSLTAQLNTLQQASSRLEVQAAELQNLKPVSQSSAPSEFVAVSHIQYLGSEPNSNVGVAVR